MEKISISIGLGWTPDLTRADIAKAGGLFTANNIMPVQGAYHPVLGKSTYNTTALSGTAIKGTYMQDSDGIYYNFLGTTTKLYRFNADNLTDITRAAGDYIGSNWSFEKYGTWVIATNYADDVQVLKSLTGSNFEALGGSPKKAKFCLLVSGHLILANLDNAGSAEPKKIMWSAREDVEDWTASLTTGADSQNFPDIDGNITGLGALGDAFVIAAQNSLTIGQYVGGTYTFRFVINAVRNIGCYYPESFISIGTKVFFWGKDSIYMFDGTSTPVDIGKHIKKTFFATVDIGYTDKITVAHDKDNGLIVWSYPDTSANGVPNKALIYNYMEGKFTTMDLDCNCIFMGVSGGILLDTLTTTLIDEANYPIDSNYWLSNNIQPFIVDSDDSKIKTFSGSQLTAELETGEVSSMPYMLQVTSAYLPIEGSATIGNVTIKHRYATINDLTSSSASSIKLDGTVDLRTTNRNISLNLSLDTFTKIGNIIEAEGIPRGRR